MIDVGPDLHQLLPNAYITAQASRQMGALPAVVAQLSAAGELAPRLVVELGTNGPGWNPGQVAALLRSLGLEQVVLVNVGNDPAHPDWPGIVNAQLDQIASGVPGATVVDWYAASAGQPEYFTWGDQPGDGVHPGPVGSEALAVLIAQAVESGGPTPSPSADASGHVTHLLGCAG